MIARWRAGDAMVACVARNAMTVDVLLAVVCTAVSLITVAATDDPRHGLSLDGAAAMLLVLQNAPVAIRRREPVLAWFVAGAAAAVYGIGDFPDTVLDLGPLLVIYTVAAETPRRTATVLGVLTGVSILAALIWAGDADAKDFSYNILIYAVAWVIGEHQRAREAQRAGAAQRAVADERARIAHELHDVVAHHVSMMVVQAEGGASVVAASPERAEQAFDAISSTGRQAMAELRRVLGVLRQAEGDAPLAPQPGLAALDGIVERVRDAGLEVDVRREGAARELPAAVDLSALRIVQEALTNTVRHARAARATVVVRYLDGAVEVEVVDDGMGAVSASGGGNGHGLVGMRERVALFGGTLDAGPGLYGGFAVRARIPTG